MAFILHKNHISNYLHNYLHYCQLSVSDVPAEVVWQCLRQQTQLPNKSKGSEQLTSSQLFQLLTLTWQSIPVSVDEKEHCTCRKK